MKTQKFTEISVHIPEGEGDMGQAFRVLEESGIVVQTWCRCYDDGGSLLLLTTNEPHRACQTLEHAGYFYDIEPVLLIGPTTTKPHLAAAFSSRLMREGIDIEHSHVAAADSHNWFLVLKTDDDDKAASLVQEESVFETVWDRTRQSAPAVAIDTPEPLRQAPLAHNLQD